VVTNCVGKIDLQTFVVRMTFARAAPPAGDKLCAFSHDALDRRRCNTQGRPSTGLVDHTNTPTLAAPCHDKPISAC